MSPERRPFSDRSFNVTANHEHSTSSRCQCQHTPYHPLAAAHLCPHWPPLGQTGMNTNQNHYTCALAYGDGAVVIQSTPQTCPHTLAHVI